MGGLYYTFDAGASWDRNNSPRITAGCYAEDGTLFVGGCGLYVSHDNGKTIQMIYPREDTVRHTMTRTIYCNPYTIAEDFDNGYVLDVEVHGDFVYFVTLSWDSVDNLPFFRCRFDGSQLERLLTGYAGTEPFDTSYHLVVYCRPKGIQE